jgi:hypothetical protein
MTPAMPLACSLVRGWTAVYTWRLPEPVREARRAEMESELWEFQADTSDRGDLNPAFHAVIRLAAGIPDDLLWRRENAAPVSVATRQFAIAGIAGALLALAWTVVALQEPEPPRAPAAAPLRWVFELPAPPPPPPPPPPSLPRSSAGGAGLTRRLK